MSDRIKEKCVRNRRTPVGGWRAKFGHDAVAVSDQHGLAAGRQADIFAKPVLEEFDAD